MTYHARQRYLDMVKFNLMNVLFLLLVILNKYIK